MAGAHKRFSWERMTMFMRSLFIAIAFISGGLAPVAHAQSFLVENGQPRAEIVIAQECPRSTRLAAADLQAYVEKISGARLPIVHGPGEGISIYVGESEPARELGITAEGLEHGAYRIVSGDNWLVLIGDDTDFLPKQPWASNNSQRGEQLQAQWETASGLPYGVPDGGMYKNRARMPADLAREQGESLWGYDERGSYNAVCGFLRSLGVRWYLPGELGEVVPSMKTIALPKIDETVKPDFEFRQFNVRFGTADDEVMKWAMRLGIRNPYGLMIAHGMHTMTEPDALKAKHPDWFALYGGKRDTQIGKRLNHLCYSNEELFAATVKWARAQFDVYDFTSVSIMPPDAYISICQCELCKGKDVPEMGSRGKLSNHVWDFVNRVAKEVGKTHPDKWVLCCAYGANTLPPTNIDKLEPNVQVVIVGGRRPRNSLPEQRESIRQLRADWLKKTDQPIMIFENYPFTGRGTYLPAFVARTIGESINATKGVSRGEDIWLSFPRYHDDANIGFDHFQVYFTARMWWGGKDAGVEPMLDEYCRLFYGPAGPKMKTFFDFCEFNYQAMESDKAKVDTALEMFAAAKAEASPDSIYTKRLALIDTFLDALRNKAVLLAQKRGPVSKLRTVWEPKEPIVIDGKLDDQYWRECPAASTGTLRELQTGRQPIFGTKVMAGWDKGGNNLYLGIRCQERPGEKLNIATEKDEDQSIWYGDLIEILLDTDSHNYYQIAVNPAGALIDLDRAADKSAWLRWQSQAEVATHVADDHWTVEIRIPVTDDENDPLNQVIGRQPSQSLPWHFNVCRQRIREHGSEYSAYSPTGSPSFHVPMKFAHFYGGRSHAFEVDPAVTDFLIESRAASDLMGNRKYAEALAALVSLASENKTTDFQKSDVLQKAAACARALDDFERAAKLADQIPIKAVASTVRMENLSARREFAALIEQFGAEEFSRWPFWQIGEGALLRGQVYAATRDGEKAEADLQTALQYTSDMRTRLKILKLIGTNRESVLQRPDAALKIYRQIVEESEHTGSADYFHAVLAAARLLAQRERFDDALAILDHVDAKQLSGTWRGSMLLGRGETLATAGRTKEAWELYRDIANDESITARQRETAGAAMKRLSP